MYELGFGPNLGLFSSQTENQNENSYGMNLIWTEYLNHIDIKEEEIFQYCIILGDMHSNKEIKFLILSS